MSRSKRHTLQDAREAVAEKLRKNAEYLREPATSERPDLVYKQQHNGTYAVGIKYGNRWLSNVFDGATYVEMPDVEGVADLLDMFGIDALAGQFDSFISKIMADNVQARNND